MIGIYLIRNKINGKKYVGLSKNIPNRIKDHKAPRSQKKKTVLARAFRKYKIDNFEFSVLEVCDNVDILAEKEIYWIDRLKPEYNMNTGGLGNTGHGVSEDVRQILKAYGKLQWHLRSSEEKERILKNNLSGPKIGHQVSQKTREKLRLLNTGKTQSEETKKKRSERMKISMIGNKSGNKPIIQMLNGVEINEFESTKQASEILKINSGGICKALKGGQQTAGGFEWKYKLKT